MQCQICNKNLGEYQCSKCGKIVCRFDEKIINNKVLCIECIRNAPSRPRTSFDSLKTVILSVAIILVAMIAILYITNNYIKQMPSVPVVSDFVSIFKAAGFFMVGGVGFILFILIGVYLIFRRKSPKSI